ncbi:TonB-dependent receptor [Rubrivivax sp. A210]|uniref:TonB-dependent receptor n=1 Tax=Rubrivivax sp. A210 TaxID=2772301 RepID=UPI001917AE89|nr:TonB-dependent receptor [Rubrivivax sp. A210]CAD5371849.1 TonB-dependent receptor [Rubrivivax sp. A210]
MSIHCLTLERRLPRFAFALVAPLALVSPMAAQAQPAAAGGGAQTVTITGTPIVDRQDVDDFGSLSTVVGAGQVRDLGAVDLSSALRRTPGVQVSRFNPVGSFGGDEGGAVYLRGMGASRPGSEVKTYVDGLPFYSAVWNHALLDLLPVQGMERLVVLKGPQPQSFGNTFGAIDLQPRRGTQPGLSGDLRLSGGSFGTLVQQATLAGRWGSTEFSLAQGHAESDGHRDAAQGRLDNGLVRGSVGIGEHWRVGGLVLGADNQVSDPGEEGLPATRTGRFDTRGTLLGLSLEHRHALAQGRLQLHRSSGVGLWDNPSAAVTRSTFEISGLRWREQVQAWSGGELRLGLDVERTQGSVSFNGFTAFDGSSQRLSAPYLGLAHTFAVGGGWTVQPSAGVRLYRHNVYGEHQAPHAGLVLAHGDSLSLRLNASRGLSFPGLDAALLNAIVPPLAGAPDSWKALAPERMDHVELGLHWKPARDSSVDLAVFDDALKNRYVFAFPPAVAQPSFTNLGAYKVRGVELSWQQRWSAPWSSFVGATLLDSSLADLPYAPEHALALGLTWQQGAWRVSADAQAQAGMFTLNKARANATPNTARVGGFGVLNLRCAYALPLLGRGGEVYLALENLGDKRYAYRPGYTMAGRAGQVGLNLGF